mmetsp:Transcript_35919/g.55161  ORF Transcript_35919/g.55161 Transcript_35919/m.55161 type:complete len:214 (+) Transcript_35919:75-716(+)
MISNNVAEPLLKAFNLDGLVRPVFLSQGIFVFLMIVAFMIVISLASSLTPQVDDDEGKGGASSSGSKKKGSKNYSEILIVGPPNSGKTSLFYYLFTGQFRKTVSSIEVNASATSAEIKAAAAETPEDEDRGKILRKIRALDIPGHFNFRSDIQDSLNGKKKMGQDRVSVDAVVLVMDSNDKQKTAEVAEILYDTMNNLEVLENKTPILICCNK